MLYRVKANRVGDVLNADCAVLLTLVMSASRARRRKGLYVVGVLVRDRMEIIPPTQCFGSRPCLRCVEAHTDCVYNNTDSDEDECIGKNLLELEDSLEVLKDDGSVLLVMKVAFAFLW